MSGANSQAGPSRPRHSNGNGHGQKHDIARIPSALTQKTKRPRDAKELFAQPDVEEQIKLSKGYRALQADAEEMRANMANVTPSELTRQLGKQAELFVKVQDTGIGTLDANLMRMNTENAMALAKKFKVDSVAFDINEFFIKLHHQLGLDRAELADQDAASDDELDEPSDQRPARKGALGDWEKIGWMAAKRYRRIPGVEFMYGPIFVNHKKRKVAPRGKRQALAPEVRPEEVNTQAGQKKGKDDFMSNVRMVHNVLKHLDRDGEGINLFELVVNPDDYGQTVENLFFVSFLLNQGKAGITVNEKQQDGEITIRTVVDHDADLEAEPVKNQAVVELDLHTWELAKNVYGIEKSAIPHRDYTAIRNQMAGNAWYA